MTETSKVIRPEHRWPAATGTLLVLVLSAFLPESFQFVPPWLIPALGVVVLLPLVFLNPQRLDRETAWSRWLSIGFAIGLTLVNQVYIVLIVQHLVNGTAKGSSILLTALQVWVTNAVAFALLYWELDRGGPIARRTATINDDHQKDFRFPQQEQDANGDGWRAGFVDYAYFSLTNMMAFSPTDVMPLSQRAKALMGYQALTAFVILALVISRAVNILT
ncbi:MAG: DUF1345 domain-containing protein [Microbacteriaceae bacterium]|nr:DUF1345 domain-containing protein [Microbacteriaceae bacterium]